MEIKYEYIISFLLAFAVAFFATPMAKKIAIKLKAIDVPKDNRRMHSKPMAKLGGLAIIIGFTTAIIYNLITSAITGTASELSSFVLSKQFLGYVVGALLILFISIVDDIKPLDAKIRFFVQIIAATIVVFSGTSIITVTIPIFEGNIYNLEQIPGAIISVLWIVGVTNAVNWTDGLDGLAAGISSIASLALFVVSVIQQQYEVALITVILAGSVLGFLPFNFNPAKIFMGDTGSMFLGFTLSVISISGRLKGATAIAIAIPLLVLGLPVFDTAFSILRRIVNGKPIMQADRGHLHHRLVDMGLSQKQSVSILYVISTVLGLVAIVLADKGLLSAIILVVIVSMFIIGGARYVNGIMEDKELNQVDKKPEDENVEVTSKAVDEITSK